MSQETPLRWHALAASTLLDDPALAADWDRLNDERGGLPILGAAAVKAALRHLGTGAERLVIGRTAERCVAMMVVVPAGRLQWQTFQPSQLPLGAWVAGAGMSAAALSDSLIRSGALGLCLVLSMTQLDPRLAPRASDSETQLHGDYIETAWVDIAGSFDDYWSARGKNLRQNMRKQLNKLQAEGIAAGMRGWTASADMAPALARYGDLERQGWKAQQGTAIEADNAQGGFYRELLETLAGEGRALVCEYLFADRVVASNLCVLRDRTLIILKTTYDEGVQGFSPAFLLQMELLKKLFEEQAIERVEYYGRVMEWHTRWTDNKRTLYHLTCFRFGWLARLVSARRKRQAPMPAQPADAAQA